ncbi:MAG TPA: hypothetical protein ENH82_14785 [bacterium]|nr:hypothetical protein [bacterium]
MLAECFGLAILALGLLVLFYVHVYGRLVAVHNKETCFRHKKLKKIPRTINFYCTRCGRILDKNKRYFGWGYEGPGSPFWIKKHEGRY